MNNYQFYQQVSGQLRARKIAPRLVLGFGSRLGLVLRLGGNQTIAPEENCLTRLGLGFGLGLVLGLGKNFPREQLSQSPIKMDKSYLHHEHFHKFKFCRIHKCQLKKMLFVRSTVLYLVSAKCHSNNVVLKKPFLLL